MLSTAPGITDYSAGRANAMRRRLPTF